jgi:hypothetical protein
LTVGQKAVFKFLETVLPDQKLLAQSVHALDKYGAQGHINKMAEKEKKRYPRARRR